MPRPKTGGTPGRGRVFKVSTCCKGPLACHHPPPTRQPVGNAGRGPVLSRGLERDRAWRRWSGRTLAEAPGRARLSPGWHRAAQGGTGPEQALEESFPRAVTAGAWPGPTRGESRTGGCRQAEGSRLGGVRAPASVWDRGRRGGGLEMGGTACPVRDPRACGGGAARCGDGPLPPAPLPPGVCGLRRRASTLSSSATPLRTATRGCWSPRPCRSTPPVSGGPRAAAAPTSLDVSCGSSVPDQ